MFVINEDKSIYVTRGDSVVFSVVAVEEDGVNHVFKNGDVVRFKVFEKKACENVVLQKDTLVEADMETVEITLDKSDTKIGDVISKPTDYWYEVELNPFTNPQTIIGYDDDGAKVFRLYPEGADSYTIEEPDELPLVDDELDPSSDRPIQNQAVARALVNAVDLIRAEYSDVNLSGYLKKKDVDFDAYVKKTDVDFEEYVKKTDYATNTEAGLVKVGGDSAGVKLTADKMLVVASAGVSEIQKMESANRPITPYYLKYAIKTGLTKNDLEWTEEEKSKARTMVGALGRSDVVDNLLSDATDLPVSAKQAKKIYEDLIKHSMPIYTDLNANLLGITATTTLNQLVVNGLVPKNSIVKLWINDGTTYGREVRQQILSKFSKDVFGYLTIERIDDTRYLTFRVYDSTKTYSANYTATNSVGWSEWEESVEQDVVDKKLDNDYSGLSYAGKGIKFPANSDGSFFTLRPYLPNGILQITLNDQSDLFHVDTEGNIQAKGILTTGGNVALKTLKKVNGLTVKYYKRGNTVSILLSGQLTSAFNVGTSNLLNFGALETGCRPPETCWKSVEHNVLVQLGYDGSYNLINTTNAPLPVGTEIRDVFTFAV